MEHRHSKGLRFISILLVLAMLMTTATFTVLAEEAAEAIAAMTVKAAKDSERNVTEPIAESSEEIADEYEGKTAEELQSAAEDIAADVYEESSAADAGQQTSASDAENAQLDETLEEESLQSDSMDAGLEVLSSSDSQPEYLTPDVVVPFDTSISEHESITVNTGALTYSEKLLTFSGLSGAEEPLWLRYNSDDASLYDLLARQYLSDCDYRVTYKYTYYRASTGERLGDSGTIIVDYENEKDARALEEGVKSDNGYIGYDSEYGCKVLNRTTVRVTKINCTYTYRNTTYPETRYEELFGMSGGWFFDLPYMDGKTDTLYLPGVGKYTYTKNNRTYTVHVQSGQIPISMEWLDNEDLGEFGIAVCMVTVQDGTIYYFDAQKRCLCAKDRFDNTVMYRWNEAGYFAGIRDADGKETSVCYTDTDTQRTITIIAPDESETILNLDTAEESFLYNEERGWDVKDTFWILNSIRYPSGESTEFRMQRSAAATHHLQNGRVEKSSLDFMLLSEVRYPIGSSLQYKYEEAWAYVGGVGANKAFHVTERYMTDGVKHTNTELYTYTGNYAVITSQNPSAAYSVNITLPGRDPHIRKYTFNDKHKCVLEQHLSGTTVLCEIETWYDAFGYPRQMVKRRFGNTKQSVLETTELFTHSSFGNLLTYISPKSEGISKKTDYRTTYTYNGAYNLPLTVEYKQDSATTVKTVNTLTADKKSIAESCTYVNNTLTAKTAYTYNSRGQMTSKTEYPDVTAESGITTTYTYDGANLASETVTGMTDADGNALDDLTTSYTYDIMGRLLTATDAGGRTTTNTYDARGRLLTAAAPDGSVTTYEYDLTANDTTVLRAGREDMIVDFDSIGQKQSVYYASGDLQKEYFYDSQGRLAAEATGRGSDAANTIYYAYDAFDRVTEKLICDKLGAAVYRETTAYDDAYTSELSLVTKTVHGESGAPDAVTKTYTNKYGETVKTDDSGVVTKYAYDYVGNPLRAYYTQDGTTVNVGTYTYDFRGNVLTETNALGDSRTVAYDAIGRKISESDFKGNTTAYTYDAAGRLLTVDSPLDGDRHSVVKYTYDGAGNITKQMQSAEAPDADTPAWRIVEYTYDDMNRVTDIAQTVDDGHKVWMHYAYNAAGDLTDLYTGLSSKWSAAVNPDSYSRTHYAYNNRGKATSLTDALGQDETYVYDALGYVTEVTQRDGTVTRYTYNALGKPLTEKIYADAEAEAPISQKSYRYYANGLIRSVNVDGNAVQYTYDAHGNVLTETERPIVKSYSYDARGRKNQYTLKNGNDTISTATYAYDEADRLISVTEGGVTTTYTYDENGNRASQMTGAVSVAYTYNDANLVTGLTNTMTNADGEEVVISAFAYTYYADGNQYTKSETMLGGDAVVTNYVYDGLGRLISETKGEDAIAYTYDRHGNRVGLNHNGAVTTYTYDANNRLLSETVGEATKTYTYDANGNTLFVETTAEHAHIFENGVCRLCGDLETYRLGDMNLDDEYTLVDVLSILKLCEPTEEPEPEEPEEGEALSYRLSSAPRAASLTAAEDLNGNGVVDTDDYMLFLYDLLGIDFSAPTLLMADETTAEQPNGLTSYADLDGSGTVDTDDYAIALSAASEESPVLSDRMARLIADVNGDGIVARDDATEVLHYVLNNGGSSYPIGSLMTNTTSCAVVKTYAYNERGQQTGFANAANTAAYAYNPNGLRNVKTVGGSTKYFVYNGMNIVYEYSESVADGVTYFYGLNRTHNSNGEIYVYNAHGDVVQLVKDNAVEVSYTYDAFGNITSQIGTSDNPFLYCGEYFDAESQAYYLRARYYDPANGRFNAEDTHWNLSNMLYGDSPVKMNEHEDALGLNRYTLLPSILSVRQSCNLYVYCVANPILNSDFTGCWTLTVNLGANAVCLLGTSAGIGISFDGKGNIAVQWNYSSPTESDKSSVGLLGFGAAVQLQVTEAQDVYGLEGTSSYAGGSLGNGPYVGIDLVSCAPYASTCESTEEAIPSGLQVSAGYGAGVDIHAEQTYTQTIYDTTWEKVLVGVKTKFDKLIDFFQKKE